MANDHENDKNQPVDTQDSYCAEELAKLKMELNEAREKATYLSADFENYRRRIEKDRIQTLILAQAAILKDILPIVDDFDRAFAELQNKPELTSYVSGFELIYKSLQKILVAHGVTEIPATGAFNPEYHEAVMHVDDASKVSGEIVQMLQKGYLFKGAVLRPAKVSVKP